MAAPAPVRNRSKLTTAGRAKGSRGAAVGPRGIATAVGMSPRVILISERSSLPEWSVRDRESASRASPDGAAEQAIGAEFDPLTCTRLDAADRPGPRPVRLRRIGLGPDARRPYFRGIPDILRAAGQPGPGDPGPPDRRGRPGGPSAGRADPAGFPDEPVHLIGHSMGGLDARALLADPAWAGRILSLTTIATPHLGSAIADFAKLRVGRIYRLLDAAGDRPPRLPRRDPAGRRGEFNRRIPPPAGSPASASRATPPPTDVCWPLRRLHAALSELEGPNDGLVSVESATGLRHPPADWPVDHLRQMNWLAPEAQRPGLAAVRGSTPTVVDNLAAHRLRRARAAEPADAGGRAWTGPQAAHRPASSARAAPASAFAAAVRSSRTATVMSPRTFEVVRQRSRNQSIVSRTGICRRAGRRRRRSAAGSRSCPRGCRPRRCSRPGSSGR